MHAELSFGTPAGRFGGEQASLGRRVEAVGFAGGVQWLGRADRMEGCRGRAGRAQEHTIQPVILGAAHGPRILELLCMAG